MPDKPTYDELEKRVLELEKAVQEIERSKALLDDEIYWQRRLVRESRDGIVVIDKNIKVYVANNRFAEMLGYSLEEVNQLYVWDWDAQYTKDQLLELAQIVDDSGHHFETRHRRKDGSIIDVELSNNGAVYKGQKYIFCICRDITERKRAATEREKLIKELQEASAEIKTLRGILPLCVFCKNIRDDEGYWEKVDVYISKHSKADISHSVCPECLTRLS
ncbi:MAG: PAS domain S-box protein, partial [Chlorobiales bacterium]|nr:PAS domain S-box protein [Chlorobiales bacterium]